MEKRESEMEMKSTLFNYAWMQAHGAWWLFSDLDLFNIVRIMTWIRREGRRKLEDQRTDAYKNLCTWV